MIKDTILFLSTLILLLQTEAQAQDKTSFEDATDAIFEEFQKEDRPGITYGIVQNGEVLYLKGFGMADLETKRPINLQTKFQVDDFAKQFTVLAILLLEEQGKVSFEDDIRKYIPQLPNFSETIQIKHLINHTTGLDDYYAINRLIGASPRDVFTHQDALRLIAAQQVLNHSPGTHFSLRSSDTEITLMAEIVAKASGKSLATYAQEHIFSPLKMTNTLFCDDYEMVIPNLARSYQSTDQGYKKKVINSGNAGPTNLYISVEDMATWYAQFSPTKKGFAKKVQRLHTPVTLDNGTENHNSWGVMSLARDFYHLERGVPKYWIYGLHGGYGANMFLYPEQDLVSFAIGNNDSYNGYYAMRPLEPLLEGHYKAPPIVDFSTIDTKIVAADVLKQYEGYYWDEQRQSSRSIVVENDSLRFGRPGSDMVAALVPLSDGSFQMVVESDDIIIFNFRKLGGETQLSVVSGGSDPTLYSSFEPKTYRFEELREFTGTFYQKELNINFNLSLEDGQLVSTHLHHGKAIFAPEKEDVFRSSSIYFSSISFTRDKNGAIKGFKVTSPGIVNLEF